MTELPQRPGALAALVLAGGVAASAPLVLFYATLPERLPFLNELDRDLRRGVELATAVRLDAIVILATVLASVLVLLLARRRRGRGVAKASLLLSLVTLHYAACGYVLVAIDLHRVYSLRPFEHEPRPVGRVPALAEEVVAAFARTARERHGTVTVHGVARPYLLLEAPGARPRASSSYEPVSGDAACVLLPWGPEGNADPALEPWSVYPAPVGSDRSSAALGASTVDDLRWSCFAETEWGQPELRITRTFDADGELSYALLVRRAKVDATPSGAYTSDLYEVHVLVFSGFDPSRASEPRIPQCNSKVTEFVTLVRR